MPLRELTANGIGILLPPALVVVEVDGVVDPVRIGDGHRDDVARPIRVTRPHRHALVVAGHRPAGSVCVASTVHQDIVDLWTARRGRKIGSGDLDHHARVLVAHKQGRAVGVEGHASRGDGAGARREDLHRGAVRLGAVHGAGRCRIAEVQLACDRMHCERTALLGARADDVVVDDRGHVARRRDCHDADPIALLVVRVHRVQLPARPEGSRVQAVLQIRRSGQPDRSERVLVYCVEPACGIRPVADQQIPRVDIGAIEPRWCNERIAGSGK